MAGTTDLHSLLVSTRACGDAREWAETQPTQRTAWESCERGDWLLWICGRINIDRKHLVRAACECAKLSLKYVPPGEDRPRKAIETAIAWSEGSASIEDVRKAREAAYTYASTAADAAAIDATAAAVDAVDAADGVDVAATAAYAIINVAYIDAITTADAGAGTAARKQTLKQCADIVRSWITWSEVEEAIQAFK